MTPGTYNLTIRQGSTLTRTFQVRDALGAAVNLSGYAVRMSARESLTDTSTLFAWSSDDADPYITIVEVTGTISLLVPPSVTAALSFIEGVWDMEIYATNDTDVHRILEGSVFLSSEVTRES